MQDAWQGEGHPSGAQLLALLHARDLTIINMYYRAKL